MAVPAGTFMATARNGTIQFPAPIKGFCAENEWTLFRVSMTDGSSLELRPVPVDDVSDIDDGFCSSLTGGGVLWIPAALREMVGLGEQSVMMRVENGGISVYLRKVFETLGFRP
jgi:hypothetical protein